MGYNIPIPHVVIMEWTRFEKARIIGARALQISMGAPSLLMEERVSDPAIMAQKEFNMGILPITPCRVGNA